MVWDNHKIHMADRRIKQDTCNFDFLSFSLFLILLQEVPSTFYLF
jgi:hypothetical protein